MKTGNCSGCEKEGIVSWTGKEWKEGKLKGRFILGSFGSQYACCNRKCYLVARGIQTILGRFLKQ